MPRQKYEFGMNEAVDFVFRSVADKTKVGELRVKGSTLLWKKKSATTYKSVSLDDFIKWIEENGRSSRM